MSNPVTTLIILLAAGLLLIGGEIFVPGAILGTFGFLALLGAIVVAFSINTTLGVYVAVSVVGLVGLTVYLWIRFFPHSAVGRKMTLSQDGRQFKSSPEQPDLLGATGDALSDLRPAGFALLHGKRVDVISNGGLIPRGAKIRVIRTEGNRIFVSALE